jgi:hypothetical protein
MPGSTKMRVKGTEHTDETRGVHIRDSHYGLLEEAEEKA